MASRGNPRDTAHVLLTASEDGTRRFSERDYWFYSVQRRPFTLRPLENEGIIRKVGRGQYELTQFGREWSLSALGGFESNPKRPPRQWWRRCVRGVEEAGSAVDPESVCGAQWYRKMSESQRRRATREAEGRSSNPMGAIWRGMLGGR